MPYKCGGEGEVEDAIRSLMNARSLQGYFMMLMLVLIYGSETGVW